ncbi:hypothetical protein TELCIR_16898, partial [Teladorsagia circumcincta]
MWSLWAEHRVRLRPYSMDEDNRRICIPGVAAAALSAVVFAKMRRSSLEVLLCGLSLFDVLVLLSTLLIYPAMNACQNEPNP